MAKEFQKKWWFKEAPKEFKEELIRIDRVTRVTAWWRQLRFRASVIVWDFKGTVWLGIWKAWEVIVAIEKAVRDGKKNMIKIKIVNWTIAHNVTAKYKAASVMLHPASEWTWIIAGSSIRKVLSLAWIKDVLAKRYWSTNPITNARATLKALANLKENSSSFKKVKVEEVQKEITTEIPKEVIKTEKVEKIKEVKKVEVKNEKDEPTKKEIKKPKKSK